MKSSETNAKANQQPQTMSMPISQVTGTPVPGYTTEDFWRDLDNVSRAAENDEYSRFYHVAQRLVQVPKSEIDEKRKNA